MKSVLTDFNLQLEDIKKLIEFYEIEKKLSKEFEKGGEKRGAAKRISESLQNDLKDFMNDSIPLMLLICSPGMKERHWQEIEDSTGVTITKGGSYTLSMMTEIGMSVSSERKMSLILCS